MDIYIMQPEHPTNADLQRAFEDHAKQDEKFQSETKETDKRIEETLGLILNKLDPDHKDYILKAVEERLDAMDEKMEPLLEIYKGFVFGRRAILWTSGIVGGLAIIAGSVIATIRFIR